MLSALSRTQQSFEAVKGINTIKNNLKNKAQLPTRIYFIKAIGLEGEHLKKVVTL